MPPARNPAIVTTQNADYETRKRIIEAARRCFVRHGVGKTSIEDVAKLARIARSGIYRYFATRQDIVEAAIIARMTELIDGLAPAVSSANSFAEALVIGSLATVDVGRNDPELQQMLGPQEGMEIVDLLAGSSPVAHHFVSSFWKPILERGRALGEMREDISIDDAIEWMRSAYVMLILRKELEPAHERNLLEQFLVYSLLTPAAFEARLARLSAPGRAKKR